MIGDSSQRKEAVDYLKTAIEMEKKWEQNTHLFHRSCGKLP